MYRIIIVLSILCISFTVSCKSISSGTKDALYEGDREVYYYAWRGDKLANGNRATCMSWCERKPESVEEALEEGICTWELKYITNAPELPLGIDAIVDVTQDIEFLYLDAPSRPLEEVKKVCLNETVIDGVKQDRNVRIQKVGNTNTDNILGGHILHCYSCYVPNLKSFEDEDRRELVLKVPEEVFKTMSENVCRIKDNKLLCFESRFAVVKAVKYGLSYDEAVKYCKTPTSNSYVIDWNKVTVGAINIGKDMDFYLMRGHITPYRPIWIENPSGKYNARQGNNNYTLKKDSKDAYTVCVTPEENLKGVYIYRIDRIDSSNVKW